MTDVISTGEAVTFWILGPLALLGGLGMVFARNAVHSAGGDATPCPSRAARKAGRRPARGMVPAVRVELTTFRLQGGCSTS